MHTYLAGRRLCGNEWCLQNLNEKVETMVEKAEGRLWI
jgi:hypothetical protein